ncbi:MULTISPECIES: hypothetical protein [unclassified Marinomonas]|uniref:hypothetical protein n=1 Tax=unclassified Marinomonas TaxID=196814 RepID=UPI000AEFCEEA|nr:MULTISPECIES: hypothetical protein [unclassified Marinomonas]
MLKLRHGLLALTIVGSHLVNAESCPDYEVLDALPNFTYPAERSFEHTASTLLSSFYSPYHIIHDQVAKADEPVTIVGKFDYSRVFHKDLED